MGQRGPISKKVQQVAPIHPITQTEAPDYLDEVAAEEWTRIVNELKNLSNLDVTVMALYCQAYSDWRKYSVALLARGETYTTAGGQVKFYPEYNGKREAYAQLVKTAAELGFSPNSRSRMNVQPAKPKTDKLSIAEQIQNAKGNEA